MRLLDFFFPKRCLECGRLGRYFCFDCRKTVRYILHNEHVCPMCGRPALDGKTHPKCHTHDGIDGLTTFFHYDGIVRKAVKALKYRYVSDLADEFVSLIPSWIPGQARNDKTVLIPIPLHVSRKRERGFNQAEVLGTRIAAQLHIPIHPDILRRDKKTIPQVEMKHRKERLKNMEHVFVSGRVTGDIILFDDVFTSGATMRGAAGELKRAGATRVWAITIAR